MMFSNPNDVYSGDELVVVVLCCRIDVENFTGGMVEAMRARYKIRE